MPIELIQFTSDYHQRIPHIGVERALEVVQTAPAQMVNWLDVSVKDRALIQKLAQHFNIHDLIIEDIFNDNHLPKYEQFPNYCFIMLKMLSIGQDEDGNEVIQNEQISILLGQNWVITVQEVDGDVFDEIRHRIAYSLGNLRKRQADYLFYRLIDVTVDNYFLVLESIRNQIEALEETIVENPELPVNEDILHLKKQLRTLRRFMLPLRSEVNRIRVEPSSLIHKSTLTYLNDVYDHLINLESSFETFREMLNDLLDLHFAHLSNNMNKIMRTLTTVSTLFIPLTFIAGVYGMNFEYMPELAWTWSYPALLLFMLGLSIVLIIFMRKKGWF